MTVESTEVISEEIAMNKKPELTHEGGSVSYLNNIPGTPAPAPFFSQVVWAGDTAYLAGLIGLDPITGKLVESGIVAKTERTIDNIEAVQAAAGLSLADVARVTVCLSDIAASDCLPFRYRGE